MAEDSADNPNTFQRCVCVYSFYSDAQHGEGIMLDMEPDGSTETHSSEDGMAR